MPDWLIIAFPVLLAAILAALGGIFLRLGDHGERLARLETAVNMLATGHRVVNCGANPSSDVGSAPGSPRT